MCSHLTWGTCERQIKYIVCNAGFALKMCSLQVQTESRSMSPKQCCWQSIFLLIMTELVLMIKMCILLYLLLEHLIACVATLLQPDVSDEPSE